VIYAKPDLVKRGELGPALRGLKRPYILVTGQSDYAVPGTDNAKVLVPQTAIIGIHHRVKGSGGPTSSSPDSPTTPCRAPITPRYWCRTPLG
jgi:hypothetical protein